MCPWRKGQISTGSKKAAVHKPGRELSSRNISAITLLMDFLDSKTMRNKYLHFKALSSWYFVIAA